MAFSCWDPSALVFFPPKDVPNPSSRCNQTAFVHGRVFTWSLYDQEVEILINIIHFIFEKNHCPPKVC
jgi:hypothetical protein